MNVLFVCRSRFLRNQDRAMHSLHYPKLFYPELYLIEGGYKAFFSKCKVTVKWLLKKKTKFACTVIHFMSLNKGVFKRRMEIGGGRFTFMASGFA